MKSLSTTGFDFFTRTFLLSDGSLVNCHIYDTAGQERFNSISVNYYKKADAILLVYDISQRTTFEKIKNFYVKSIKDNCKEDVIILLIGNKADLEEQREVKCDEGISLALQEKYEFKESSCLHNRNVSGAFEYLLEEWNFRNKTKKGKTSHNSDNKNSNSTRESITLEINKAKKKKKKCC